MFKAPTFFFKNFKTVPTQSFLLIQGYLLLRLLLLPYIVVVVGVLVRLLIVIVTFYINFPFIEKVSSITVKFLLTVLVTWLAILKTTIFTLIGSKKVIHFTSFISYWILSFRKRRNKHSQNYRTFVRARVLLF